MTTNLPGPGAGKRPGLGIGTTTGTGDFEEPKAPGEQPLEVSESGDEQPKDARPIVKPDNWVNP